MNRLPFLPQLDRIPVYVPGRPIDEVARELGLDPASILKLASNENPLGPSPKAMDAVRQAVPSLHLYPDGSSFRLKKALAAKFGVEPENLLLGNGSNEILELSAHIVLQPDQEVVVSQYCFAVYPIVTHMFGGKLVTVPARQFGHDVPAMLKAVTPNTRLMFVANPNNPTGTLIERADVALLLNELPPHVLLVMDEAYIEFLPDPIDLLPFIRSGTHPNLLLSRTFSKIYGLAGLRVGYGFGHPDLIAALEKVRQPFNLNAAAQAGALGALADDDHVKRTREMNVAGRAYFERELYHLKLHFVPSFANFILVHVGDGARVFHAMQRRGVITRPMASYGLPEWLRLTLGTPAENQRCLKALTESLPA
ncbi:MAG: histidinol-phosphate transaminase [Verrucomicrobia bacterium]|nr:histidinol-phosphate transaminase [Verrucomicrobiota bacterium]